MLEELKGKDAVFSVKINAIEENSYLKQMMNLLRM